MFRQYFHCKALGDRGDHVLLVIFVILLELFIDKCNCLRSFRLFFLLKILITLYSIVIYVLSSRCAFITKVPRFTRRLLLCLVKLRHILKTLLLSNVIYCFLSDRGFSCAYNSHLLIEILIKCGWESLKVHYFIK